jgi:hypothetical protein
MPHMFLSPQPTGQANGEYGGTNYGNRLSCITPGENGGTEC